MKIKVNRVRGGSMGDQRNYGLVTGSIWNYEDKRATNNVSGTMTPSDREDATIEAERGETVVGDLNNDGQLEHLKIGGKRHAQGGTPLNVPDGSFVFSDFKGLLIKNKELLSNVFNYKSGKSATPAKVARRYELNRFNDILNDPNADFLDQKTAQLMLDNNLKKLGQLALVQESMKGFPDGIPDIAMPLFANDVPQRSTQPSRPRMKKGGLVKAQNGLQTGPVFPKFLTPQGELEMMQEQYPGYWLPEVTIEDQLPAFTYDPTAGIQQPFNPNKETILQYATRVQENPRFINWIRPDDNSWTGYETSDSYLPGSRPNFKPEMVTGAPADWLIPTGVGLGVGTAVGYGPQILNRMIPALQRTKGLKQYLSTLGKGVSKLFKNPAVRGTTAGLAAGAGTAAYMNRDGSLMGNTRPPMRYGTMEESRNLIDSIARSTGDTISEREKANQLVREQQIADSLRRLLEVQNTAPTLQVAPPTQSTPAPVPGPTNVDTSTDAIMRSLLNIPGYDSGFITPEMIEARRNYLMRKKRGGTTIRVLPKAQTTGQTGVFDLKFAPAVKAASQMGYEPDYSYWSHAVTNLPFVEQQGKRTHAYGPSNIWYPKGGKEPNLDEFKDYQLFEDDPNTKINWDEYGGFDKWKQDRQKNKGLAAGKAEKFWIDQINKISKNKTGTNLYDVNVTDVYEPGMQWSTPARFRKKAAAPAQATTQTEQEAKKDEMKVPNPQFQAGFGLDGVSPYPPDLVRLAGIYGQRFPQYAAYMRRAEAPLISPTYRYMDAAPTQGVATAAMESAGAGPAARASQSGVAGKALAALNQLSGQTDEFNRQMASDTARANQAALMRTSIYNAEAPAEYIADINRLANAETADVNRVLAAGAEGTAKLIENQIKAGWYNAMHPYAKIVGPNWDVAVNPTIRDIYTDVGSTGNNFNTIFKSVYGSMPDGMSEAEKYKAAVEYTKALLQSGRGTGTSGAAPSIFDLMT